LRTITPGKVIVEGSGRSAELHASVERPQGIQGIVQCLVFFNSVSAGGEEFPCPCHDRLLGVGDSRRKPVRVDLEECSSVKLSPFPGQGGGSALICHKNTSTHGLEVQQDDLAPP